MKRIAAAIALLALCGIGSAIAQIETVIVNASALAGTWTITWPAGRRPGDISLKMHCRIDMLRTVACFERKNGRLTVEDGKLRILWSPTLADSNVIDAQMTSADSFTGEERARMMGVTMITFTGLTGKRQEPAPGAPDVAAKAPLLRAILEETARGSFNRPYEGTLVELPKAGDLSTLGPVTAITYMDDTYATRGKQIVPDFFRLYAVDFQNGRLFCGLHLRDDGFWTPFVAPEIPLEFPQRGTCLVSATAERQCSRRLFLPLA